MQNALKRVADEMKSQTTWATCFNMFCVCCREFIRGQSERIMSTNIRGMLPAALCGNDEAGALSLLLLGFGGASTNWLAAPTKANGRHRRGGRTMDLAAIVISQYQASLEMLKETIARCPESVWDASGDKNRFWHTAYHALFFTHLYLEDSEEAFTPWIKHREGYEDLETGQDLDPDNYTIQEYLSLCHQRYEDFEDWQLLEPYDKYTLLEYLAFCQQHVAERVPRLKLEEREGHGDRTLVTLELQLYSIRHLMQHTGELMERLGARTGAEIEWVGWKHGN
jgi:hypothetical protein